MHETQDESLIERTQPVTLVNLAGGSLTRNSVDAVSPVFCGVRRRSVDEKSPGVKTVTVRVNPAIKDAVCTHADTHTRTPSADYRSVSCIIRGFLQFSAAIARTKWKTE